MRNAIYKGAAMALAFVVAWTIVPAGSAADEPGIKVVGKVPLFDPPLRMYGTSRDLRSYKVQSASVAISPARRRLYQIVHTEKVGPAVQSVDLDSFRSKGEATGLPTYSPVTASQEPSAEHMHAIDEEGGRLFVAVQSTATNYPMFDHAVMVFDLDRLDHGRDGAVVGLIRIPSDMASLNTGVIKGMKFHRNADGAEKLLVWFLRTPGPWMLTQWDVPRAIEAAREGTRQGYGDWLYSLTNCRGETIKLTTGIPIIVSKHGPYIYTVCHLGTAYITLQPALYGRTLGVIRIALGPGGIPLPNGEEVFSGPPDALAALADPETDRISIVTEVTAGGAGTGQTLWTFDGRASRFVGAVGMSLGLVGINAAYGIDPGTGRVYAVIPNQSVQKRAGSNDYFSATGGLLLVDARLTPTPQALAFPEFARPSQARIWVDPATPSRPARLVFRRALSDEGEGVEPDCQVPYPASWRGYNPPQVCEQDEPFYTVLEDNVPVAEGVAFRDQDRFTVNVPEQPGVTDASFEGTGGAYAARVRFVGGLRENAASLCTPDERELTVGWSREAELTTVNARAKAVGLAIDSTTDADLDAPAQRCGNRTETQAEQFDEGFSANRPRVDTAVECSGDGKNDDRYELPNASSITADANCKQSEMLVTSAARTSVADLAKLGIEQAAGVKFGEATSKVTVTKQPDKGIVVRAEAVVRNIEIPMPDGTAPLRISSARAIVESWSNGRPTAQRRVTFERIICGVAGSSFTEGACFRSQDDPQFKSMVADVNRRLGGKIAIRIPDPDPDLLRGSDGGYIAGLQKTVADLVDDQLLNGDSSLEVPAIEIVRYADTDDSKVRQIIRLAGVRAATTYGIFLLPNGSGFPPDPEIVPPVIPEGPGAIVYRDVPVYRDGNSNNNGSGQGVYRGPKIFGLRARPLGETAKGAIVWLALCMPFYLAWRRQALVAVSGKESA